MSLFNKSTRTGGFMDEIRCDEPSYLIWKWHPKGTLPKENDRENAIRYGSSLRVKDGEVAVFVYKQGSETFQEFIEGPYDEIIKTKNFPILGSIVGLAYEGGTPFQAEIYFINLAQIIQIKFGVPFFDLYDPRFMDFGVPTAVRGTVSFKIKDYREFIKLHRLNSFDLNDFQREVKDVVCRYVKDVVANAPAQNNIPLVQIEKKISQISDTAELYMGERLEETFGVVVSGVDISAIELDKSSDGYSQLMNVTRDIDTAKVQAQKEDYIEKLRIQREESQYAQHKQTQTANIGAFQVEKQAEVGIAGAEALGQMGVNGAGNVNLGGSGEGINMAAMMSSMAIGSAVGQNIAGSMNNAMSSMNQPVQTGITPPPIPTTAYYVADNGQAVGPYDLNGLKQLALDGKLNGDYLVWKKGMAEWVNADSIDEIKTLLIVLPIPQK